MENRRSASDAGTGTARRGAVLAVTTGGLGDAVLFSPVLKAARRVSRCVHLLVASDLVREVYGPAPEVDEVHVVDTNRRLDVRTWLRLAAVGARLRRSGRPAAAVFASRMHPVLCRMIAWSCGASRVVMAPHPEARLTDLEVNLDLARRLGADLDAGAVFVPEFSSAAKQVEARLAAAGIGRFMAVYPSTERRNRPQWPCVRLAEAARAAAPGIPAVVLGGTVERDRWLAEAGVSAGFHVFAGEMGIRESVECLRRAEFAICNDGGLMHVAGALNRPLAGVMLNAAHYHRPPGRATEVVVPRGLSCHPCYPRRPRWCRDPAPCIEAVSVDDVVAAVRRARAKF